MRPISTAAECFFISIVLSATNKCYSSNALMSRKTMQTDRLLELNALRPLAIAKFAKLTGEQIGEDINGHTVARIIAVRFGFSKHGIDRKRAVDIVHSFIKTGAVSFDPVKQKHKSHKPRPAKSSKKDRYEAYINSPEWKMFRLRIFAVRGARCEDCASDSGTLHLHHLTYKRFGKERDSDVRILCVSCHQKRHPGKLIG